MNFVKKVVAMFIKAVPESPKTENETLDEAERRHRERLRAKAEATRRALEAADQVFQVVAERRHR